ncbi:cell division protein FtsQ/DivIB [Luedemannella helvata]|uniref:Cell division protein FtsQ n=1 Tax=Luedemannella helvata TaxID=349315 RepID=A0ABN2JYH2_9ACTN
MIRTEVARRWRLVRAPGRSVPASVRRFHQRIRRRRLRSAAPWLAVVGALGLAALLAWVIFATSLLGVREVAVTGTSVLTSEQVTAAAGVAPGTPLARVDLDRVRAAVSELAPVREARVRRQWPGTLVIDVQERVALATVPVGSQFAVIDGAGVVFRTLAQRPRELPLVVLASPGPDDVSTRSALRVLRTLTPQLRESLVRMVAPTPARIRLELGGGRTVVWGDAEDSDTKARVATALLKKEGTLIDVSAPEFVTVG